MSEVLNAEIGVNQSGSDVPEAPETPITELFLDTYVIALYSGIITQYALSMELYISVGDYLQAALVKGFGKFDTPTDSDLFDDLARNLRHFSAAKQYQQNRTILSNFIAPLETYDFKDFKAVADPILANYNKNWLRTEWATSVAESQSAREWNELINSDAVEFIEYVTQEDSHVRHEHAVLNGAIYPKGSSFWNSYFPPNGFNCFPSGTKVLTLFGWKEIQSINPLDKVIGGSGKEQTVKAIHVNPFDGMLIRIKVGKRFISCTPNHRFLTTIGWIMAKNIMPDMILVQDVHKFTIINKPVRYINHINTIFSNIFKAVKIHGFTHTFKAFNSQVKRGNIDVNPMMRYIMVMFVFYSHFIQKFNNLLFSSGWFSRTIGMPFGFVSKKFHSGFSAFSHYFRSMKRRINFKFLRDAGEFLSFVRVYIMLIIIGHSFRKSFTGLFSPFGVVLPLNSNSITTGTGTDVKFSHHVTDLSGLNTPSFHNLPISESMLNVEVKEGFVGGAPLDQFDSIEDFFRSSLFSHKFNIINEITNIPLNADVYNLEVENDNSYITEVGITHNCRCFTVNHDSDTKPKAIKNPPKFGTPQMPKTFDVNPGKDRIVFPNSHPYFRVAQGDKVFREANYGMPL